MANNADTAGPVTLPMLTSLLVSAEADIQGHLSLFRGAVHRGDQLGQEREQRLAQEAVTRYCELVRAVWVATFAPHPARDPA